MKNKLKLGFVFKVAGLILLAWVLFLVSGMAWTLPAIDFSRAWASASAAAFTLLVLSGTARWFYQNGIADINSWLVSIPTTIIWLLALFLTR